LDIDKVTKKVKYFETELAKYVEKYKHATTQEDKTKWKKEAMGYLKKKKFYEEYLDKLRNSEYKRDIKMVEEDLKKVEHDLDDIKKETKNLFKTYIKEQIEVDENVYEIPMTDDELEEEFMKIASQLRKLENFQLDKYFA
jgi:hypothetical protein